MAKLKGGRHSQAKKTERQDKKRKLTNQAVKSEIKTLAKKIEKAIEAKKIEEAKQLFVEATKRLDQASAKNIIHKNNASRKKSRLAKKINSSVTA